MNTSVHSLQGGTRLIFDSIEGLTSAVEEMHSNIAATPFRWLSKAEATSNSHGLIAASVYAIIRGINNALRNGVDSTYDLIPKPETASQDEAEIRAIAAVNGAFGDHLEATGNPLATSMTLLAADQPLALDRDITTAALPQASPHLVILAHGLSLSELSWSRRGNQDIGERLEHEFGSTALHLRYNSGRHISTNGQQFASLLERLCETWPVPVESISLLGHSMGGLVIRSACWYAEQAQASWLQHLQRVICLGTPHHGSPLEKAGHLLDLAMLKTPYTEPLAFGRKRSAGIKDLRHGNLLDEDWQGYDPDQYRLDSRRSVPLLHGVDYYFAAAIVGLDQGDPLGQLLGDLLVRLDSAVGSHAEDLKRVNIGPENCRVFYDKNHFDLLDDERVHQQIVNWFNPRD